MARTRAQQVDEIKRAIDGRPVVLVGMMGAGKTAIGRRLAHKLKLPFQDADAEIEAAAGQSISDMFEEHGEAYFRDGERRVIARLMNDGPQVLATGGGAIVDDETRALIKQNAVSIWINADIEVLAARVTKRNTRPLLKDGDIKETLQKLIGARAAYYGEADVIVKSRDVPHDVIVDDILEELHTILVQDHGAHS